MISVSGGVHDRFYTQSSWSQQKYAATSCRCYDRLILVSHSLRKICSDFIVLKRIVIIGDILYLQILI